MIKEFFKVVEDRTNGTALIATHISEIKEPNILGDECAVNTDVDLKNAYPTAMSLISETDWSEQALTKIACASLYGKTARKLR